MDDIKHAMTKYGFDSLLPAQRQVLPSILEGRDTSIILKTGGGKSILYQLPAVAGSFRELTVVFSPLIALQMDQMIGLEQRRKSKMVQGQLSFKESVIINSDTPKGDRDSALARIRRGNVQLLYIAPEQLTTPETANALARANIVRVVVDEAHVLLDYAQGFRPAFGYIGQWIANLPHKPQILTFSATMSKKMIRKVQSLLGMEHASTYQFPIRRNNLNITMKRIGNPKGTTNAEKLEAMRMQSLELALSDWKASKQRGSAIIYCTTIRQVKQVRKWLKARKWAVTSYHGKQKRKKRANSMAHFMSGEIPIMVATNAFGLGVDKADVRLIVHISPPISLDGYVQEIGRAGRDGKPAQCVMFYASSDWATCQRIIGHGSKKQKGLKALQKLTEKKRFKWKYVEKYFGWRHVK